jgi:hypothetical protein
MPEYRVFVRDLDNHILSAGFTFICENDQEALAKTEKLMDVLDLELWCQGAGTSRGLQHRANQIRDLVTSCKRTLRHYLHGINICKLLEITSGAQPRS